MLKRYILLAADSPIIKGFAIGFIPLSILGFSVIFFGFGAGVLLVLSGIPLGIILAIVTVILKNRYITYTGDYSSEYSLLLLKVEDGKVTHSGDRCWGKENIFLVKIPTFCGGHREIYFDNNLNIPVTLEHVLNGVKVSIKANLIIYGPYSTKEQKGFLPQEIYDFVVKDNSDSVEGWFRGIFENTIKQSKAAQDTFEKYGKGEPHALISAIRKSLNEVHFDFRFSNITNVEVVILSDAATYGAKIALKH